MSRNSSMQYIPARGSARQNDTEARATARLLERELSKLRAANLELREENARLKKTASDAWSFTRMSMLRPMTSTVAASSR
jgi:hypothetical protein